MTDNLGDIFGEDEEAPTTRPKSDLVGRVSTGYFDKATNTPGQLTEFRFMVSSKDVAQAVAQRLGGAPLEIEDAKGEFFIQVQTDAEVLRDVVLAGPDAIYTDQKWWVNGELLHHCTGRYYLDDERKGQRCDCPPTFEEKKAKGNRGAKPDIRVRFTFADDPELGIFELKSSSWMFRKTLHEAVNDVERVGEGGPTVVNIVNELVEYTPKKGKMANKLVSYRKPLIQARAAYDDAITDAPDPADG